MVVSDWRAERRAGGVRLAWQLAEGADVVGFHVYRGATPDGPFEKVTERLLAVEEGQAGYALDDHHAPAGAVYYRLEAVSSRGKVERLELARCDG